MAQRIRVSLWVWAFEADREVYNVIHIGFFPKGAIAAIVAGLDATSLAYASNAPDQTGMVDVVYAPMKGHRAVSEVVARRATYMPRDRAEG